MMKLLLILLFISSSSSFADCYEQLTQGFKDSAHFKVYSGDVYSNDSESLDEQMAINAINKIYLDLGCTEKMNLSGMECAHVLKTTLCRVDVNYGYFLIAKDYVDTVNILFNRWD